MINKRYLVSGIFSLAVEGRDKRKVLGPTGGRKSFIT